MNIDDLTAWGADTEDGLRRCMGNEGLYLRLVNTVKDDASFDELASAIGEGRFDDAFETAHGLKGSLGNLALTPLYAPMCEITEHLRSRTEMDYAPLLETISDQKARLAAI